MPCTTAPAPPHHPFFGLGFKRSPWKDGWLRCMQVKMWRRAHEEDWKLLWVQSQGPRLPGTHCQVSAEAWVSLFFIALPKHQSGARDVAKWSNSLSRNPGVPDQYWDLPIHPSPFSTKSGETFEHCQCGTPPPPPYNTKLLACGHFDPAHSIVDLSKSFLLFKPMESSDSNKWKQGHEWCLCFTS